MTQNRPHIKRPSRAVMFTGAAAASFAILVSGAIVFEKPVKNPVLLSYADKDAVRVSATLQSALGTQDLQSAGKGFDLPSALKGKLSPPYILSSSLYPDGTDAQDFVFSVSQDGKKMNVLIDGFSAGEKVTLALNDHAAFKDVPMDWSGRIELAADLKGDEAIRACVEIGARDITLCHSIAEAPRT